MNTCNSANSAKLGKLLKRFKLKPKNKQKLIQEAQKDYSTWSSLERLAKKLEFKYTVILKKQNDISSCTSSFWFVAFINSCSNNLGY